MDLHEMASYGMIPTYEEFRDGILKLIDEGKISRKDAALVLPELRESDDERRRKQIEQALIEHDWSATYKVSKDDCLAYLEKQKERKPEIQYVYPKFRVGDLVQHVPLEKWDCPVRVKYIGGGAYSCESDDNRAYKSFPIKLENEYELVEQKPAEWSEEDERNLYNTIEAIKYAYDVSEGSSGSRLIAWLKFHLRPQSHWKPSQEQMEALHTTMYLDELKNYGGLKEWLVSLYDNLKNL